VRQAHARGWRAGQPLDEDLTTPEDLLHDSRFGALLERVPAVTAGIVQVIVDNPAQFTMVAAGTLVLTRLAFRAVQPRSAVEALALFLVLQVGIPKLGLIAVENGWLTFKIRDDRGRLIPLVPGKVTADVATSAAS
jgi:hypothetical protein